MTNGGGAFIFSVKPIEISLKVKRIKELNSHFNLLKRSSN